MLIELGPTVQVGVTLLLDEKGVAELVVRRCEAGGDGQRLMGDESRLAETVIDAVLHATAVAFAADGRTQPFEVVYDVELVERQVVHRIEAGDRRWREVHRLPDVDGGAELDVFGQHPQHHEVADEGHCGAAGLGQSQGVHSHHGTPHALSENSIQRASIG